MEQIDHIVRYDKWCTKCEHCKTDEVKDPCNECLDFPTNTNADQPVMFKEKE